MNDRETSDWLGGPYESSTCADCGADFRQGDDYTTICPRCWDLRDSHTDALELRMAKADLRRLVDALAAVDLTTVKEVA